MEPKHEWFKLGLDPAREGGNSDLARRYPSPLPSPPGYVAKRKLVTDYLTALRKHTENILERKLSRNIASRTPKEYILTVPALWSPRARDATLSCASDAGMGSKDSIHIITEPEAATLYELNERTHLGLNVGDTFVVCDAGGGYAIILTPN
jgi:molecular chaperone DnaK (HSP70)